jgi:hypothetical protein
MLRGATILISIVALLVSGITAWRQYQLAQRQYQFSIDSARRHDELTIAHAGAQAAMAWRDQVIALHDRGLESEEIRWIMYCENGGEGYEIENGIIDEVLRNVPRVRRQEVEPIEKDPQRRLPRPDGRMRSGDGGNSFPA